MNYDIPLFEYPAYEHLEEFTSLCCQYSDIYIYGDAENQKFLTKYLKVCCGILTKGFITSATISNFPADEKTAVILGLSDKYYNEVYPELMSRSIKNIIFLTEYAKRIIAWKMKARLPEETNIEINITDHCNLNCRSCDHFSPIAKPRFIDESGFEQDIKRISELTEQKLGYVSLLGGEPLLHQELPTLFQIARHFLPNTAISIYTNGLLLLSDESERCWKACRESDISIKLTSYPEQIDIPVVVEKAKLECVKLEIFRTPAQFEKGTLNPVGDCPLFAVVECFQMNKCTVLRNGKIFMCPLSAYISHFNLKFGETFTNTEEDWIDIHKAKRWEEIAEFLSQPVPFCRYCDIGNRELFKWSQSEGSSEEWVDLPVIAEKKSLKNC